MKQEQKSFSYLNEISFAERGRETYCGYCAAEKHKAGFVVKDSKALHGTCNKCGREILNRNALNDLLRDTGQCVEYGEKRIENIKAQIKAMQDELVEARQQLNRAAEADEFIYATLMGHIPVRPDRLEEVENEFRLE